MSELKAIKAYFPTFDADHNEMLLVSHTKENYMPAKQIECYLKSEADKVIAKLKADYKEACYRLQTANLIKDERLAAARHHKYKRCLGLADMCSEAICYWDNVKYTFFKGEAYCFRKLKHYGRWGQIWLAIAEKFKPNKEAK